MSETFKWAVFSPGRIARQFADAVDHIDRCAIKAVASKSLQRATDFANDYAVPEVFTDYLTLLKHSDIDAVYIASVHSMHYEQIKLCINAGTPVLCEKPITVNAQQLKHLHSLAATHGVFMMEALWTRFLPIIEEVNSILNTGVIGNLQQINASFGFEAQLGVSDRLINPELAGGVLLDLGIYPIALSQYFNPYEVSRVSARAKLGITGVDEQLEVNLDYINKVTSSFKCSIHHSYENAFNLIGDAGRIEIKSPFWGATTAYVWQTDSKRIIEKRHLVNGFEYQINAAVTAICHGQYETQKMPVKDSLENMLLMDTIRRQIGVQYPFESD